MHVMRGYPILWGAPAAAFGVLGILVLLASLMHVTQVRRGRLAVTLGGITSLVWAHQTRVSSGRVSPGERVRLAHPSTTSL
jgi:hypothetical protein